MRLERFPHPGGDDAELASLAAVVAFRGLSGADEVPLTPELLFGIAGGIGAGYFVFEYQTGPTFFLGTRHSWHDQPGFVIRALKRLGLPATRHETSGSRAAEEAVAAALRAGQPAIVFVDMASLSHLALPAELVGYQGGAVVVHELDRRTGRALIADPGTQPVALGVDDLDRARGAIRSLKRCSIAVGVPEAPLDLTAAVRAGISACLQGLEGAAYPRFAASFGLRGLEKWAVLVGDGRDRKGWPRVFDEPAHLFDALRWTYSYVALADAAGSAHRATFAAFLAQVADLLASDAAQKAARLYSTLADDWAGVARAALPDTSPILSRARLLLDDRERLVRVGSATATEQLHVMNDDLLDARRSFVASPPTESERRELLEALQERVARVATSERDAAGALRAILT